MTGALDKLALNVGSKLIAKFGKAVTLTRVSAGSYDPSTGTTTNTTTTETVDVVAEDYTPYQIANGLAGVGDKKLTASGLNFTQPSLEDMITMDGLTYSIVEINAINSGEQNALYVLRAKKR